MDGTEKKRMNAIVEKIGQIQFDGNITPHNWYQSPKLQHAPKCEGEKGKPNLVAITLLADIVYWYRPVILRDEMSGREIGRRQKFAADKLQKNYEKWGEGFGLTKRQVEDAMAFLKAAGLVTVETRSVVTEYGRFPNCAFIEPVLEAIEAVTFLCPVQTGGISRSNGTYLPFKREPSPVQTGGISRSTGQRLPFKRDDPKTPTKNTQKTSQKAAAPPGGSPSAVSGQGKAEQENGRKPPPNLRGSASRETRSQDAEAPQWANLTESERQVFRERADAELSALHSPEGWENVKHKERLVETRAMTLFSKSISVSKLQE